MNQQLVRHLEDAKASAEKTHTWFEQAGEDVKSNPKSDFHRAVMVWTVFAKIDSDLYQAKKLVDAYQQLGSRVELTAAEHTILSEHSYNLKDNGEAMVSDAKLRLIPNLKFVFRIVSTSFGVSVKPDFNDSRWQDFSKAIDIRDRLTHPNELNDLTVDDDNLETLMNAANWFHENMCELYTEITPKFTSI